MSEKTLDQLIGERAYQIWQKHGDSLGGSEANWQQAEREILAEMKAKENAKSKVVFVETSAPKAAAPKAAPVKAAAPKVAAAPAPAKTAAPKAAAKPAAATVAKTDVKKTEVKKTAATVAKKKPSPVKKKR